MMEIKRERLPVRAFNASKFDCGRALLICGSTRYYGAPFFSALAAVKSGCGLCYLAAPSDVLPVLATKLNEPIFLTRDEARDTKCDACLIGPGISRDDEAEEIARDFILNCPVPTVVDADALYFLAKDPDMLNDAKGVRILTPHEGEFKRLCPDFISSEREYYASRFAEKYNCILVLKGANTLVAMPDGRLHMNRTGNPGMAKGGSGDVLAGIIVSFFAQGFDHEFAACMAVYLHGLAGDMAAKKLGIYGMTPTDILEYLPQAIKRME